jgi:hypothetical protein
MRFKRNFQADLQMSLIVLICWWKDWETREEDLRCIAGAAL